MKVRPSVIKRHPEEIQISLKLRRRSGIYLNDKGLISRGYKELNGSIRKRKKMGRGNRTGVAQKRKYKGPINICENVQPHLATKVARI